MTDHADILGPSSSPATDLLTGDLGKAQAEYPVVKLDSSNPHFKSRFASYQQCCESLRGPLTKHGLALPDFRPGLIAGTWVLQGFGAAVTYAKRTLLMALTGGFSGEPDDDGQAVSKPDEPQGVYKSLAYEQGAKKAISEAATIEEAQKHLDTVRLRCKEKVVPVVVYRRLEAEFDRVWKQETE
jgi:hypothetical protein